jgi:hypothetical protein
MQLEEKVGAKKRGKERERQQGRKCSPMGGDEQGTAECPVTSASCPLFVIQTDPGEVSDRHAECLRYPHQRLSLRRGSRSNSSSTAPTSRRQSHLRERLRLQLTCSSFPILPTRGQTGRPRCQRVHQLRGSTIAEFHSSTSHADDPTPKHGTPIVQHPSTSQLEHTKTPKHQNTKTPKHQNTNHPNTPTPSSARTHRFRKSLTRSHPSIPGDPPGLCPPTLPFCGLRTLLPSRSARLLIPRRDRYRHDRPGLPPGLGPEPPRCLRW